MAAANFGMSIIMADHFHEANRRRWDAASASWASRADARGTWRKCHLDASLALHSAELKWLGDIAGKSVAVLGSGDNQVVFALSGLGAKVTSVDISGQQIEVARRRAAALGLTVDFVQADVVDLSKPGRRVRRRLHGRPRRRMGFRPAALLRRSRSNPEAGRPADRQRISSVPQGMEALCDQPRTRLQLF
jgi:hypothetical protein